MENKSGRLFVISTPIGNWEDISRRALRMLQEVDIIAAEDTRYAHRLLSHYQIKGEVISCHSYNEAKRVDWLLSKLGEGKDIGLISDAGTPAISDPGAIIVAAAAEAGFQVVAVPGPSAITAAMSISGLKGSTFRFIGFIARKGAKRQKAIQVHADDDAILIFYESPRRIIALLEDCLKILGDRPAVLCNDLTKIYEKILRGTLSSILTEIESDIKGEIILLVGASAKQSQNKPNIRTKADRFDPDFEKKAKLLIKQDYSTRDAARILAEQFSISKQRAYQNLLKIQEEIQ